MFDYEFRSCNRIPQSFRPVLSSFLLSILPFSPPSLPHPHPGGGAQGTPVPHSTQAHTHLHTPRSSSFSPSLPSCSLPWLALISENLAQSRCRGPLGGVAALALGGPGLSLCCCALMIVTLKHSTGSQPLLCALYKAPPHAQACIYSRCSPFRLVITHFLDGEAEAQEARNVLSKITQDVDSALPRLLLGMGRGFPSEHCLQEGRGGACSLSLGPRP